jgi:hypothetical protein
VSPTVSPTPTPSPTATPRQYGDADGDYDIDSADFSEVRNMIMGQSDLNPGGDADADGDVDAADFSEVRNLLLEQSEAMDMHWGEYDFSSGADSDKWAKRNSLTAPPPVLSDTFDTDPTGWINATSNDYTNISSENGVVWTIAGVSGNYTALQCKFTVSEGAYAGNITSIGVTFNGTSEQGGDLLQLWVWNFSSGSWRQIDSDISLGNASNQGYTRWTGWGKVFDDYIDVSNHMYILYSHNTSDRNLNIDYVKLEITAPE